MVNIDDWMMVGIVMVWVVSWVGVHSLVVVMDQLVVHWLDLVASIVLKIMGDCLMWCVHIVLSDMMVVVVEVVSIVIISVMEMSVFECDSMVVIVMMVSAVFNFVVSLMINEFVAHIMMLRLTAFYMRLNLVNSCLLKRSVV